MKKAVLGTPVCLRLFGNNHLAAIGITVWLEISVSRFQTENENLIVLVLFTKPYCSRTFEAAFLHHFREEVRG